VEGVSGTPRADFTHKVVALAALFLTFPVPSFACQNSCAIIETNRTVAVFEGLDGKALTNADVIIRDATAGTECRCGKFGKVVKRLRSDKKGRFKLRGLRPGDYWVTYMDQGNGESFYVRFEHGKSSPDPLELAIDRFGSQCYLVDVERNIAKPASAPKPRQGVNNVGKEL